MDIKDIALKVAKQMREAVYPSPYISESAAVDFAEALVAEIQRQSEPYQVAYRWQEKGRWLSWYVDWTWHDKAKELGFPIEYAYSSPSDKAQIEQRVAEAIAAMVKEMSDPTAECDLFKAMNVENERILNAIRSGEWKKFKGG